MSTLSVGLQFSLSLKTIRNVLTFCLGTIVQRLGSRFSLALKSVVHVPAGTKFLSFIRLSVSKSLLSLLLQTGQLNEYTERKEMSSSVICMALGRVPAGEQRSRFLAVGLADNTIRIISLQPQV